MGKQVVRVSALAVLISYFPSFGGMMKKAAESMKAAHAKPEPDSLVLADETSAWRSEVYLEVTREVSGLLSHCISETFCSKDFEDSHKDSGKWYAGIRNGCEEKENPSERITAYYATF